VQVRFKAEDSGVADVGTVEEGAEEEEGEDGDDSEKRGC
jgi:hypothetical protein